MGLTLSGQGLNQGAERFAPGLEVLELIEGGAGRRQHHHGARPLFGDGDGVGLANGRREIARLGVGDLAIEGIGKGVGCLAY